MRKYEEESKGSTSGDESEYESDNNSVKEVKGSSVLPKAMTGVYLSTNLITERNLTLADIKIDNYTLDGIENMEAELIDKILNTKLIPLLIDLKTELKR